MAYIVKQKINGKDYFYLRKSVRKGKKVTSQHVAYLGSNKEEAEKKYVEIIKNLNLNKKENKMEAETINEKEQEIIQEKEVKPEEKLNEINAIASKRGFFFQTANIYGGKAGFFTYGHLGKLLKTNWEASWRENILSLNDNFYEIQGNNILPEPVFKASGHIENFNDPMTECKKCHFRFRADTFLEDNKVENSGTLSLEKMNERMTELKLKCPKCGGELMPIKQFNMMFPVNIGFNEEKAYLSPETAQAAYLAFKEEFQATRSKLPLGLAIIDKAYRNEISPRQMFFRLREFSQAELQIFFDPDKINEHEQWEEVKNSKLRIKFADKAAIEEVECDELNKKFEIPKFYLFHAVKVQNFYLKVLKIPKEKFRLRELNKEERAFYNKLHFDVEVLLDTLGGFKEVAGIHYRTDHDLLGHSKISGKDLTVFYENKKILPHVLELSFGVDRNVWMLLDIFYSLGKEGSMFKFPPKIAPVKAAVFPLIKREDFEKIADEIVKDLKEEFNIAYDKTGSIGRRYARNDEIGTPFCITIDDESIKNKDVTIRDRNSRVQKRIPIKNIRDILRKLINQKVTFEEI